MDETDPEDDAGKADVTEAFDRVLAVHLRSVSSCRLFVGDDLDDVNWSGIDATFGALLAEHPDASILAVYDDSVFGRGRYGFVVTDRHVHYVQRDGSGVFALADVLRAAGQSGGLRVVLGAGGRRTSEMDLWVDEHDAQDMVRRWLGAVATANRKRKERPPPPPSATQVLDRLELMATKGRLRPSHVGRLLTLADRLRAQNRRGT